MRPAESTTDAQVAAAKTGVHVSIKTPGSAAEAAAHITAAKSTTAPRVGGIGAEAPA
jgi:hypothetical protein